MCGGDGGVGGCESSSDEECPALRRSRTGRRSGHGSSPTRGYLARLPRARGPSQSSPSTISSPPPTDRTSPPPMARNGMPDGMIRRPMIHPSIHPSIHYRCGERRRRPTSGARSHASARAPRSGGGRPVRVWGTGRSRRRERGGRGPRGPVGTV
eukprot:scaffold1978_cov381-Prasinococcus_capsulatus_cf.AAC.8